LRETFRYVAERSGLQVSETDEYITINGGMEILGSNFVLGIGEYDSAQEYQRLFPTYKGNVLPFVWFGYPFNDNVTAQLTSLGLEHLGPLTGLAYDLTTPLPEKPVCPDIEFIEVTNQALYQEWCEIFSITWDRKIEATDHFFKGFSKYDPNARAKQFVVKYKNQFVGGCILDIQNDIAGCYWACVLPEFRKQGICSYMAWQRMNLAKQAGANIIVVQCGEASLGVYQRLGFTKYCDMALLRLPQEQQD